MVKSSFIAIAIATLAVSMVSAAGVTDSGCYGNELNHNASLDREQCVKQLISQTGVNRHASYASCKCSAAGMTSREAAQALYSSIKGNMDPRENLQTCFVNVGDCFNQANIRTCGTAQVDCGNI